MSQTRHHKRALIFSLLSTIFLVVMVYTVRTILEKPTKSKTEYTDFNLKKVQTNKKKKLVAKKPPKRKLEKKLKALKPKLSASIKGQSFGLDTQALFGTSLEDELLSTDENIIMDEHTVDEKPRALKRIAASFPQNAIDNGIDKGKVEVRMLVNKEGKIEQTQILSSSPKGYFEDSVVNMLQGWVFSPARYKGKAVGIWVTQLVKFGE